VNRFDHRAFGVELPASHFDTELRGMIGNERIEVCKRAIAVHIGLSGAEHIKIRSVNHKDTHVPRVREGKRRALENGRPNMSDRIVSARSSDGSIAITAGITTGLVRETQQRHALAPTASAALGRLLSGAALLAAGMKGTGRLSLQISSSGPLRGLVADVSATAPDEIGARGYAYEPSVDVPLNARGKLDVGRAVGKGRLQVTRSYEVGQPYMGVVPLVTGEIGDDIARYLFDSEQVPSIVALGVLVNSHGVKASGGVIAQVLPGSDERTIERIEERAKQMTSVTTQIDNGAGAEELALALAGDIDIKFIGETAVKFACRCTRERVETALIALGRDELADIASEQIQTEAICEFCKQQYLLSRDEVRALIARLDAS
jgi:molecular chaperone Hsp33